MLSAAAIALSLAPPLVAAGPPGLTGDSRPDPAVVRASFLEEPRAPTPAATEPVGAAGRSRYTLGPGDSVRIRVIGNPEFDTTTNITRRSTLVMPILGELKVPRETTVEAVQNLVVRRLADGYLRNPRVLVELVDYSEMTVWVFGHVGTPGEHELTGPTTVMQLLRQVGNLREDAGETLTIERRRQTRTGGDDGEEVTVSETETVDIDLHALLREGDLSHNISLEDGDKLYIPPSTARVYALGEVSRPGFYPFRDGMRLADLFQLAGGFTEYANRKKVKVRRHGEEKPLQVNMNNFYSKGELDQNIPLVDGDVVVVNSSFFF